MVITDTAILMLLLFLVRPLQKNAFFILYFALMIGTAFLTENFWFSVRPFSTKAFLLFIPYHLVWINLVTFIAYGTDKKAAVRGSWRVPEAQLHTLEFLGGWPFAFIGQKVFHHKTKKRSFRAVFWLMLILQITAIWYILTFLNIIG